MVDKIPRVETGGQPIMIISLLYHDVVSAGELASSGFPQADAAVYKLSRPEFESHLEAIRSGVRSSEVILLNSGEQKIPAKALLFTFDDGGVSAMSIADQLEARRWRGHFFIATDFIGQTGFLTGSQIRELRGRGHLIGSHSCSHPARISHCPPAQLAREWDESVQILANCLGEHVAVASVPGGFYAPRVAKAARAAGIEVLFTSEPTSRTGISCECLIVGRYSIQHGTSAHTVEQIARGDAGPRVRQYMFWTTKKILKRIGGRHYIALRKKLLEHNPSV
ncbi:MAG: polysaccharide deacetylase family protein [Candidatus Sulfotelmatobacter sp.]